MIQHDFVGKQLTIVDATNTSLIGKQGLVVDETKNTLHIESQDRVLVLLKDQITFVLDNVQINGSLTTQRPEKRTKLRIKRWQRNKPKQTRQT